MLTSHDLQTLITIVLIIWLVILQSWQARLSARIDRDYGEARAAETRATVAIDRLGDTLDLIGDAVDRLQPAPPLAIYGPYPEGWNDHELN